MTASYARQRTCRVCGENDLDTVLDYGLAPVADKLVETNAPADALSIPLTLVRCRACGLLQLGENVAPALLFDDRYPYFSSTSRHWVDVCRESAKKLIERFALDAGTMVVEIASNDGYLLRNFDEAGIPVLGVDPAAAPVEQAVRAGIPTRRAFFDGELAARLAGEGVRADLVIANNVLAHVPDPVDFVGGIASILKPGGVVVAEAGYAADLFAACAFDTVYHQHQCYFSLAPLARLFATHGLVLFDAERIRAQGGSIRVYAGRQRERSDALAALENEERAAGIDSGVAGRRFAECAGRLRGRISALVGELRDCGARIAAYGAAAKGTTLLHFCGLDRSSIEYVVDLNAFKQGKFMPGSGLPIRHPGHLLEDRPDYVLLLPWNLRDEIVAQLAPYLEAGGRIIVPLPSPEIVEAA